MSSEYSDEFSNMLGWTRVLEYHPHLDEKQAEAKAEESKGKIIFLPKDKRILPSVTLYLEDGQIFTILLAKYHTISPDDQASRLHKLRLIRNAVCLKREELRENAKKRGF